MALSPVVLASSSPRRVWFLEQLGLDFRRVSADVDETYRASEPPHRYVRRLALEKARTVAIRHPDAWVIGADTTVVVDREVLGKPRDAKEARSMLRKLSGRGHRVLSGIALVHAGHGVEQSALSSTNVHFRDLNEREIRWYVNTGEALDKAGAYALQGKGGMLVTRIAGSYSNVVGFPLEKFYELWRACGLPLPS